MDAVEPFTIEMEEREGRVVVTPRGELDMASAPELEQAIMPRLQDGAWVLLDLRSLDFIDSSGLRVVVGAHRLPRSAAGASPASAGRPARPCTASSRSPASTASSRWWTTRPQRVAAR